MPNEEEKGGNRNDDGSDGLEDTPPSSPERNPSSNVYMNEPPKPGVDFLDEYEPLESVEWGPRPGEDGYDTDQELAPRPKPKTGETCRCEPRPPGETTCRDRSCLLYTLYEECRPNCPAGASCGNRRLQNREFKRVRVKDAGPKGRGLFCCDDVEKGDFLGEYLGRAIKASKLNRLFSRYRTERRLYIMSLDQGVYLDAKQKGGVARFINHSCEPNCRVEKWTVRGIARMVVVAIKSIKAGEEATFDYKWHRSRGRAPTKCHCGTPSCRGSLETNVKSQDQAHLERELDGHWERIKNPGLLDQSLVNRTIKVYSKEHDEHFIGQITGYDEKTNKHCVLYPHDMTESWEDLTQEDWHILNAGREEYVIAKKKVNRNDRASPTISLLTNHTIATDPSGNTKHYLYVQTPVKEALWAKHVIDRVERNCGVQISVQQFAKPPLPCNENDPEDVEKYQALTETLDGTVWKLSIAGTDVPKAYEKLKMEAEKIIAATMAAAHALASSYSSNGDALGSTTVSGSETHELIFPRQIMDAMKRKLPVLKDKCRSVVMSIVASESKSRQFSRLLIEGSLLSDIQAAKESLWDNVVPLCIDGNVPMTKNKVHVNLGVLGGELSAEQFMLMCPQDKNHLRVDASEDLNRSPFFRSFQDTYQCSVWVQAEEDRGRINSKNQIVDEGRTNNPRKIFIGKHPKDVPRLWGLLQTRGNELARGVKYYYLGVNRAFQPLLLKNGGQFYEYIHQVTGATVSVDTMTGDHLRIDGWQLTNNQTAIPLSSELSALGEAERAALAEEIIRLQIELYRNHCISEQSWIFGRDWSLAASFVALSSDDVEKRRSFQGQLDRRTAASSGIELAQIVTQLGHSNTVAAHAAIILFRFVSTPESLNTQIKVRDAVLACIFLANKAQKTIKWKRLGEILEAGYETFYPGTKFDKTKEDSLVLEERVMAAEHELLKALEYDVFWRDVEWIISAATGAGKMPRNKVDKVLDFAFSGQVLSAGPELWLKYGVDYVITVAAAFVNANNFRDLMMALSLIPLKVSQAAELLVESGNFVRPAGKRTNSHPLLEGGKAVLTKYLPQIQETCLECMKTGQFTSGNVAGASSTDQRYKIIASRSRKRKAIRSVPWQQLKEKVLPIIDFVSAETSCTIYVTKGQQEDLEDIVLDGPWRSVELANFRLRTNSGLQLEQALDITQDTKRAPDLAAKAEPGLLRAREIVASDGWEETVLDQGLKGRRLGGKSCMCGKVSVSGLRAAGLQWWIPASHGASLTGSITDTFMIRRDPLKSLSSIKELAIAVAGENSPCFPTLTARNGKDDDGGSLERYNPVSLQQWPPEKVGTKEAHSKGKPKQIGFSAAALQQMQFLTYLHSLISSPFGHPNFVVPIGVAVNDERDTEGQARLPDDDATSDLFAAEGAMFSLFRSSEENEKFAKKEKNVQGRPHLVFQPTPFILQRFMSKHHRDELRKNKAVMASWFHDLLSALVHCHSNHILLRLMQPDQLIVDHNGTVKFGGLYRCTALSLDERNGPTASDEVSHSGKKDKRDKKKKRKFDKRDDDDDFSKNPYAAPEILLGREKYTKESDVWAMGCVLAHLLIGKPLMAGKDRESLLNATYKVAGTPAEKHFKEAIKLPQYKKPTKKYHPGVAKAIEHKLKDDSKEYDKAIDLLARMLHLDPSKRSTAEQALSHEYMADYQEQCSNSDTFRRDFVKEWVGLKELACSETSSEKHSFAKRKALLMAGKPDNDSDDDDGLYDWDEMLQAEPDSKRAKN